MSRIHLRWAMSAPGNFRTGVSLHGHTLHSRENLDFIYLVARKAPPLAAALRFGERRYRSIHGAPMDLSRGWWTPPLGAHDAWELEKSQLECLDLQALVSLTDHDDIEAPMSLQVLSECRGTPVSLEWTVPFRSTFFHLGIHNLPPDSARSIFREMETYTLQPEERRLRNLLPELAAHPDVLVVFNHPHWDEKGIGHSLHQETAREFLRLFGPSVHALELNGLRPWRENRGVAALAKDIGKPVISGGDRHAVEPNALVNMTNAGTFAEFVEEVREGWSDVLVLDHYRESHPSRILHNMIDVLRTYHQHAKGWSLWSDRVFYRCGDEQVRSLTELFGEHTPAAVALFVGAMQLASVPYVRRFLRGAFLQGEEVLP